MPPRPSRPMMRYRSASTIPGVKPPTGIESEEMSRPTGEGMIGVPAAASGGESAIPVGIWESELIGVPQLRQKRLSAGTSLEHDGHFISCTSSKFGDRHRIAVLPG